VPDDLLGYVIGPTPFPSWLVWVAALLALLLVCWCATVFLLTAPSRAIRHLPVLGATRGQLLKRRFARAARAVGDRHRAGELTAPAAAAALSGDVRAFLQQITGARAEYMQIDDIATGELAAAAPVLAALIDAQFNAESRVDVGTLSKTAEELIRTWT